MKKPVIYASSMYEDIFKSSVLRLIANDKKYLYDEIPNVLSEDFGILKEDIGYFTKELRKYLDEKEDFLPLGVTININAPKGGALIFVIFDGTPKTVAKETIIHEMCHVMQIICNYRGIEDNETEAYLLEYFCHKFFDQIDNFNKGGNKKVKYT